MNKLIPYLSLNGTAEEAINFYKEIFNGEILHLGRFGETQKDISDAYKNKIMHASLKFAENELMFSDTTEGHTTQAGTNVSLSLDFSDEGKMDTAFAKLAAGGKITMPLQDTFWGAKFGMLTDKFGINWMFNHDKKK
jgi:PhnB protein